MRIEEYGVVFETGRPVTFRFVRNTEKSPYFGSRFQQDIEPAGVYLMHQAPSWRGVEQPLGWVTGTAHFEHPLVLAFHAHDEPYYDADSWKAHLHDEYGKTGRALSTAVLKDGYDAIVTVKSTRRGPWTSEMVALRPVEQLDFTETRANPQPKDYSFYTTCVDSPDGRLIQAMVDQARQVTYETMLAHCRGMLDIAEQLNYERRSTTGHGLTLKNDWHVGYFKSHYAGCPCYYFVWSAIEHIWVKDACQPREYR